MTRLQRLRIATLFLSSILLLFSCEKVSDSPASPDSNSITSEALLRELNIVRTNPAQYAVYLETLRQYYNGNRYEETGQTPLVTQEGVAALNEAINVLKSSSSLPALQLSTGLSNAALDHVRDTGPRGITGHTGSDGSTNQSRTERYGHWDIIIGENIAYTPNPSVKRIIAQLVIDDGVPSRGHRENIRNMEFRLVGIAHGTHSVYKTQTVFDFAAVFTENGAQRSTDVIQ